MRTKFLVFVGVLLMSGSAAVAADDDPLKGYTVEIDCGALHRDPKTNVVTVLRPISVTLMPNNISITLDQGSEVAPGLTNIFGVDLMGLALKKCLGG